MEIEKSESSSDCLAVIATTREFYEDISYSAGQFPTTGILSVINIDDTIFESCKSTLESMSLILEKGHITDAFTLLRKFYDNVIVHIYCTVHLKKNAEMQYLDEHVDDWVRGKGKLPGLKAMLTAISTHDDISELWEILQIDKRYKTIRDYCNDNVHNNYFKYLYLNTDRYVKKETADHLFDRFKSYVIDLVVLHFACLLSSKFQFMSSSDYVDHLEVNMTPPDDSQYWVAPFVQTFFDEVVKKRRKDIADWMTLNTPMQLN